MQYAFRRLTLLFVACSLLLSGVALAQQQSAMVNINTADEAALTSLPNVGSAKAKAIVAYRTQKGPFKSVDDLKDVPGIGDKTLQTLRDKITVGVPGQ